jgi:excinuclease ABC subunit B
MDVGTYSAADKLSKVAEKTASYELLSTKEIDEKINELEKTMLAHAKNLEFEQAASLRDDISKLREQQLAT